MNIDVTEFEKVFFKALITDASIIALVGKKLKECLFKNKNFWFIANFYKLFYTKYNKLPTDDEIKLFDRGNDILNILNSTREESKGVEISKIDRSLLLESIEQYIKERLALDAVNNIVNNLGVKQIEPSNLVKIFEDIASVTMISERGYNIYDDIEAYLSDTDEDSKRLSTGFADIDKEINGGVPCSGKFLGVVTAPTNMGKSIMLGNLAVNALKQDKKVLIITLEMSEHVYASRIYSALYGFDINSLNFRKEELRERVKNDKRGDLYIKEFPPATMTVEMIDGFIEQLYKSGLQFDLICIDYLTLLRCVGADNSNEAGKSITRKLRSLTYKYKIPIWTACQINRAGMGESLPDLRYIAESIAIAAEADLIISLYRQEEDIETDVMRVAFLKSRLGRKDISINLHFNTKKLRFEDIGQQNVVKNTENNNNSDSNSQLSDLSELWGL